ncbi:hypothetical protein Nepgr_030496 [Nepenthes gracilis]|uniref:Uncharacterized protein n=1 Tax=Nepenthes gracilis TaxID=150966 RepID=A0AAD3TEY0_NEPGR|nr:hypothetical protein Nepgr_030496 [Nepenthes gracilis]
MMVQDGSDSEIKGIFGWEIVGIEYGCGMTIGLVAGYYIIIFINGDIRDAVQWNASYQRALRCIAFKFGAIGAVEDNDRENDSKDEMKFEFHKLFWPLSNNLSGVVKHDMFCKLKNITYLNLSRNGLSLLTKSSSTINSNVGTCPRLQYLECSSCNITEFPDFLRTQEDLIVLDLSNNKIQGHIPKWANDIGKDSLYYLNLSGYFLTGGLDLQWKNL